MINIKEHMSKGRYKHTMGVVRLAKKLAKIHCPDIIDKVIIAAYYHDIAKNYDEQKMAKYLPNLTDIAFPLRHGMVAAEILKTQYHIQDEEILNAIRYHTIPRENPTLLEKLIYVSDNNEKGRKIKTQKEVRKLAKKDLEKAFKVSLFQTYKILIKTGRGEKIIKLYEKLKSEGEKIENEMYSRSYGRGN